MARFALTKITEPVMMFCVCGDTVEANSDGWIVLGNTGNSVTVHVNI